MIGEKDKILALRQEWLSINSELESLEKKYNESTKKLEQDINAFKELDIKQRIQNQLNIMNDYLIKLSNNYNQLKDKYKHVKFNNIQTKDITLVSEMTVFNLFKNYGEIVNKQFVHIFDEIQNQSIIEEIEQLLANIQTQIKKGNQIDVSEFKYDDIYVDIENEFKRLSNQNLVEKETLKEQLLLRRSNVLDDMQATADEIIAIKEKYYLGNLLNLSEQNYDSFTKQIYLGKPVLDIKTNNDPFEKIVHTTKYNPFIYDLTNDKANILIDWDGDRSTNTLYDFIEYLSLKIFLSFPMKQTQIDYVSSKYDDKFFTKVGLLSDFKNQMKTVERIEEFRNYSREIVDLTAQRTRDFAQLQRDELPMNIWTYNDKNQHDKKSAHFVIVHDFPNNHLGDMYKHINEFNIANKYGIYTILVVNRQTDETARGQNFEEVVKTFQTNYIVKIKKDKIFINNEPYMIDLKEGGFSLRELHSTITKSVASDKGEVAHLSKLLEDDNDYHLESNLNLILGQSGQEKVYLKITETEPHAIITGKTGTGKSVLLHNIILGGAYKYSPDELNFYLFDLKGSEFTTIYRDQQLPHIKFMITHKPSEADVYQSLKSALDEKNKRNDLFNQYRVTNITEYNKLVKNKPELKLKQLPRMMLLIDEFVTMYYYETKYFDGIQKILLELATQGRSYGISMVLSTQNLPTQVQFNNILNNIIYRINLDNAHAVVQSLTGLSMHSQEYKHLALLPGNAVISKGTGEHKMFRGAFETGDVLKDIADQIIAKYHTYENKIIISGSYETTEYHDDFIEFSHHDIEVNRDKNKVFLAVGKSGITGQTIINALNPDNPLLILVGDRTEHKHIETLSILSLLKNNDFNKDGHITYLDFKLDHMAHAGISSIKLYKEINYVQGKNQATDTLKSLTQEAKERIEIFSNSTSNKLPLPKVVYLNGCDDLFEEQTQTPNSDDNYLGLLRSQTSSQLNLISELVSLSKRSLIYPVISIEDYRLLTNKNFRNIDIKNIIFTKPDTIKDLHNFNQSAINISTEIVRQSESKVNANYYISNLDDVIKLIKVEFNHKLED